MDVTFQTLFPQFTPPATLADAPVQHVDLHPAQRRVCIELTPGSYLPTRELDDAANAIATLYDLHRVEFTCRYAPLNLNNRRLESFRKAAAVGREILSILATSAVV